MFRHLIKNLSKTATEINYHFWNVYKSNYHEKHKSELDISDLRSFEQDLLKSPEVKFVQVTIILTILSHNEPLNWAIKMSRIIIKGLDMLTSMDVHRRVHPSTKMLKINHENVKFDWNKLNYFIR